MARGRNANGMGGIRKVVKNGRTYYEGYYTDPITHKQRTVSARTEKECREKLQKRLADITNGVYAPPQRMTVEQWCDNWLERKKASVEAGTYNNYESVLRLYIKPQLGRIQIQELRKMHCQAFIDGINKSGKYVHNIAGVLTGALNDACDNEIIVRNPAENLRLPPEDKKSPIAMDSETQEAFETAIRNSPYKNVFLIALHTGMRISEVLGLQWKGINLHTGEIEISGQLERKRGGAERKRKNTTKSHKKRTTIAPAFVINILKDERRKQNPRRLEAGEHWQNNTDLVFTRNDGTPVPHRTVEGAFDRIKKSLGHPELTLHVLRKTYITNELIRGTDVKTIGDSVGHSAVSITYERYAASLEETKRAAAERRQADFEKNKRNA